MEALNDKQNQQRLMDEIKQAHIEMMNQNNQIQTAYKKQLDKYQKKNESVNQSNFVENENRNLNFCLHFRLTLLHNMDA